jgi:hypothetical protein
MLCYARRVSRRALRCLSHNIFLIVITLLALGVRLVWNLKIHPPAEYVFSDMRGYVDRANWLVDNPFKRSVDEAFFPYGAHYLLAAVKALFGKTNETATAVYQAITGALAVGLAYAMSRRLSGDGWTARIVGIVGIFYYPLISFGGYYMSEPPYMLFVAASAFLTLRLADLGRKRDAWLLGIMIGLGAAVRPQLVMAIPFLGAFWLLRRRSFPRLRLATLIHMAIPLSVLLALSTARTYYHTSRVSFIAQNGAINRVFGRCHNVKTEARGGWFGPPPLGQLLAYEKTHPNAWVKLDPAMGPELRSKGALSDEDKLHAIANKCIRTTGWLKQAHYAVNHVIMLWGYNTQWPDAGQPRWRATMAKWNAAHTVAFLPPLAAAVVLAFRRRFARHGLLVMYIFSLMVVAMLYFGDVRLRTPYDTIIIVLAMDMVRRAASRLVQLLARIPQARRAPRAAAGVRAMGGS